MRTYIVGAVLVLMVSGAQAATLNVVDGLLQGASGVDVDGVLFDVEFVDGTCIGLFEGCDSVEDFTFRSQADGLMAGQALLDQVLVDGPLGSFNFRPGLTAGCEDTDFRCLVMTPVGPNPDMAGLVLAAVVRNQGGGFEAPFNSLNFFDDVPDTFETAGTRNGDAFVYARWSVTPVVPEPSTALLVGLGLTGLSSARRTRDRSETN